MADGIQTATEVTFGVETYARVVVILVSAAQAVFYYVQRQKKQCGWEKLYTAIAETVTYIIVTSLGSAGVVSVAGRPWQWPRYAGWLSTCPVLLIDVSLIPMPAAREPGQAMTSILAFQLVVLLGQTSIFFSDPGTRLVLFMAAVACGLFVFKLVFDTFVRAWRSFPDNEPAMRTGLIVAAATFFTGWFAFPVLFAVGAEGFGGMGAAASALAHALADLIAKNAYSYASWHLRWVVIREYLDRRAAEAADLEARKAKAIKDAEAGIAAGEDVAASRSGFATGLPGTSAIVAALAAEERELQRPIDVADVLEAAGDVTGPCGDELFSALHTVAALTAPAVLSGVLPAAMAREDRVRLNVVVVDNSSSRQAAAAAQIRATQAAHGMGVDVRFAFRPGDVSRVRAAHGGAQVHAVVITDEALFHACERPELDEGARVPGAVDRGHQGSVAPFSAMPAGATLGTMLGAERVDDDGDGTAGGTATSSHPSGGSMAGPSALSGASDSTNPSDEAEDDESGRGDDGDVTPAGAVASRHASARADAMAQRGMGGRLPSALAIRLDDEPHIAVGPLAAVEALRTMASGGRGTSAVIVVSTGSSIERHGRGGRSASRGRSVRGGGGTPSSRVSLYDVGADVVVAAMGRARDWTEGMDVAADIAFAALDSEDDEDATPAGGHGGRRVDLTEDSRDSDRRDSRGGRRDSRGGRRRRRSRRDSRRGSSASDDYTESDRSMDVRRRLRPGRGRSSSTESDADTSASHGGGGMQAMADDATGAKQLLAEGVRAALDAATRAVLPQGLARLVSGVARSADAVVDERVGQRRSADERRAAEGLAVGGAGGMGVAATMATYSMLDAGVMAVAREDLEGERHAGMLGQGGPQEGAARARGGGAGAVRTPAPRPAPMPNATGARASPSDGLVGQAASQGSSPLRYEIAPRGMPASRVRDDSDGESEGGPSAAGVTAVNRRGSVGNMADAVASAFRR